MLRIGSLKPPDGARKNRKRVGRGESSGHGNYSGRGSKGALSRSGTKRYPWFEGGQMPLLRRLRKKGFSNEKFRLEYNIVNVGSLARFESGTEITPELLRKSGLVRRKGPIKLLGNGDILVPLVVKLHSASKSAVEKINSAGGKFEEIKWQD